MDGQYYFNRNINNFSEVDIRMIIREQCFN